MTDASLHNRPVVCPACMGVPEPAGQRVPRDDAPLRRFDLSLPAIHCAACISGVERTLEATPGVAAARVNLSLKRVAVTASDTPGAEARLISALTSRGFDALPLDSAALEATRTDATGRDLLARIGVAAFASMNVMLLSVAVWAGADASTRDLLHWISAVIALPAVMFSAWPFFRSAALALLAGRMDMDLPISTAILMAAGVSLWETMLSGPHAFFEAAIMLTFFLLVGRYLAHLTRAAARSAAAELAALEVRMASRMKLDGAIETVPVDALRPGDVLIVAAGSRIPADGTVVDGCSEIDASMLTGETMPAAVAAGALVRAGMMNISGPLHIRADTLGEDTLLKQISRLIENAEHSRTRYATLADRAARLYGPMVYVLALLALGYWGLSTGDWRLAVNVAAAVLIITCPCGLGLAVPAVLTAASGRLYRAGVLLKDGTALEKLAEIDAVVFDKTGTLTTGHPVLMNAAHIPPEALSAARALAQGSAHPLSRAIVAASEGMTPAVVTGIVEHPGLGTTGRFGTVTVRLGRAEWVGAGSTLDSTSTWLRIGEADPVAFIFEDELREDAATTVRTFIDAGLPVTLLSGDSEGPVRKLADRLKIIDWIARATPQEKVAHLEGLRRQGLRVLMVGDGLNDAAALTAAHVSISPASAVDASRSAADLIVTGPLLSPVAESWQIAVEARRRIIQNIVFAFGYNIITVPVAFAGLVTPLFAALAMSGSSLAVCFNALRLGRKR